MQRIYTFALLLIAGASTTAAAITPATCTAISSRGHVTILAAQEAGGGQFVAPDGSSHDLPRFCRVQAEARPTVDSRIRFEVWMPARSWSARYYQLGNGGFGGSIPYELLAGELRRGAAVAATDTGHAADAFDASWALGHPQKIVDYGWRSLKETSDAAHWVLRAYYGADASARYFVGCSNGGRQALIAAQRFPADWDGVLAGAPALNWTRQLAAYAWIQRTIDLDPAARLDAATLDLIQQRALEACAPAAGVSDDLPRDPLRCELDPATYMCADTRGERCLTQAQARLLTLIGGGPADPRTGAPLYFGFEPTSAAAPDNWNRWILNAHSRGRSQRTLAEQFFRNMVFGDAQWSLERFEPARDFEAAQTRHVLPGHSLESTLNATQEDLSDFARRGGRLLMYFGWADAVISPRAAVRYYEAVSARMGGASSTQRFFRLFMAPGMTHCQGGPGPNVFGQSALTPGMLDDATHDARRALEVWVERGRAPPRLVAAKYVNDDPAQGVERTGVLCPFPLSSGCQAHN